MKKILRFFLLTSSMIVTCVVIADSPAEISPSDFQRPSGKKSNITQSSLKDFSEMKEEYSQVVSNLDGSTGLYTLYTKKEEGSFSVLAALPKNFESQLVFLAYTVKGGIPTAGVQTGDLYARWQRFGNRVALIQPNFSVRSTGDSESKSGRDRVHTDRVIVDMPIVAQENGSLIIDFTKLFVNDSTKFFGPQTRGANTNLTSLMKAKSFPENVELAWEMPLRSGKFATLYYSIRLIPENNGYKPRVADERVGFFTTTYRDIGDASDPNPWRRYINRWNLQKADPSLKMSPPKKPIVFYLEHTTPVRYRRWVREGVLEWNRAFENIGIVNAVEVYQQDKATGAHMDKDPEDARYNFVLWTNSDMGFAIGPSRVHPKTGEILDADIVMDEGFITGWVRNWEDFIPQVAMQGFGPRTLEWLASRPKYDPRVLLANPSRRADVLKSLSKNAYRSHSGHGASQVDSSLMGDDEFDGLSGRLSQINGGCRLASAKSLDMALVRMNPKVVLGLLSKSSEDNPEFEEQLIDGVPERFIGPLLKDVIMHEVGHTIGLRHNFKGSGIRDLKEHHCNHAKGKPISSSVMDYLPLNVNCEDGPEQGEFTMVTVGPYDMWAIDYGYGFGKSSDVLARVNEPELDYATDEDTWGPDPMARRFDFGKNPLDHVESQMRLVRKLRSEILENMVDDGDSWSEARKAYAILLRRHTNAMSNAANWIGGSTVRRVKKGDPGNRNPIEAISADQQRRALDILLKNTFQDDAFGLNKELLGKMTVDKWWDEGGMNSIYTDPTYPVHDSISGVQSSVMTMILNPETLGRIYDNEFRASSSDVLKLSDIFKSITDEAFLELYEYEPTGYSSSSPLITSLRRNLQRLYVDRLIDLSMANNGFGSISSPMSNLSRFELKRIKKSLEVLKDKSNHFSKLDQYSSSHLNEIHSLISKAEDSTYLYNPSSGVGNMSLQFLMGELQNDLNK